MTRDEIDDNVFSVILSHIYEPEIIQRVLCLLSKYHPFFRVTLSRLLQLPVTLAPLRRSLFWRTNHLDDNSNIIKLLLETKRETGGLEDLAGLIHHLIISFDDTRYDRVSDNKMNEDLSLLFKKTTALRKVDWLDASGPSESHLDVLQPITDLKEFNLACDPDDGRCLSREEESCYE
jgi:hypothetical protein